MRIYKIKTNLVEETSNYIESVMTKEEERITFGFYEDGNIAKEFIDDDGFITCYYMCSDEVLEYTIYLLQKYEVKFQVEDITKSFLYGQISVDDIDFQNYIKENIDIDTILDKINEFGVESLTDLDKEILSK